MGRKRATAINIAALMITLFGFFSQIATGSGVRRMAAQRAMHHFSLPHKRKKPRHYWQSFDVIFILMCFGCFLPQFEDYTPITDKSSFSSNYRVTLLNSTAAVPSSISHLETSDS